MSSMFWIALELSIPKIGLNIKLSWTVKKLDAYKFDGVAESDDTTYIISSVDWDQLMANIFWLTKKSLKFVYFKQ